MPTWDPYRPSNLEPWNVGDGRIRDNFDYLQAALRAISTFALNPADPLDRAANKIKFGPTASRPVTTLPEQTGIVYFDTDVGRTYVCTDGTTNTWDEQHSFGALVVNGLLTSLGGSTFTGAMTVNSAILALGGLTLANAGDLILSTGRRIDLPTGEASLKEGTDTMRAHLHGTRHRLTGADGAWVSAKDPLKHLVQDMITVTNASSVSVGAFTTRGAITRNLTGRSGASRILAIGTATFEKINDNTTGRVRIVDGSTAGSLAHVGRVSWGSGAGGMLSTAFTFDLFLALTAASHTFNLQVASEGGSNVQFNESAMLLLDLGDA